MIAPMHPAFNLLERGNYAAFANITHGASRKAGWYNHPNGTPKERNRAEMLALMHSEISEAWTGFNTDARDDHLPHRRNVEVEIGDYLIRHGDFAGFQRIGDDVDNVLLAITDHDSWRLKSAAVLFNELHVLTSQVLEAIRKDRIEPMVIAMAASVRLAVYLAQVVRADDLGGAIIEKIDFNAIRADHKLEARGESGGKNF